jgi:hypothetical protein
VGSIQEYEPGSNERILWCSDGRFRASNRLRFVLLLSLVFLLPSIWMMVVMDIYPWERNLDERLSCFALSGPRSRERKAFEFLFLMKGNINGASSVNIFVSDKGDGS